MKRRARLLSCAKADLDDQADYFDMQRDGLGSRYLLAVEKTVRQIARSPELNARYGFENVRLAEIRVRPVDGFPMMLVFYRIVGDEVEVLRVIHGARDIDRMADEILPE